ncbi:MAG: DMT family transporter [Pseudomonadota bacterium]
MPTPSTDMSGRAWIELILLASLWGGSFFSIEIALAELGPMTAVLHRVGWAMLLLWIIARARGLSAPRDWRIWGAFLVMGALNNVIPFGLMSWGQTHIESGLVSIFNAMTAPLGVLVAAIILRDEPLTARRSAGVALGFIGVVVVIGADNLMNLDWRTLAQWAVLAGALSYAFASVWGKLHLRGVDPMIAAAGMLTGSTMIMFPVVLWTEGMPSLALEVSTILAIGYYAVFATALAYLLYYRVLAMAGAGNLMLCTLLIPPIAITLGWLFLDERLPPEAFGGFAMIALGLVVIDGRLLRRLTGRA